jgi:putative glycosyltransferase (TIGR04348 family)
MKVFIACPAPPRSRKGNRITAVRWARILKSLGLRVTIGMDYDGRRFDLLVALHARHSYESVCRFRRSCPQEPVIVALTGTDLYRDIRRCARAGRSIELADRLVVLQPLAIEELPSSVRGKARVVYQSTTQTPGTLTKSNSHFQVVVLGHLRPVKDPFRTALALRHVPNSSRIGVIQVGQALHRAMAERARRLSKRDRRYTWIGEVPRWKARRILAASDLLVLSSRMEGGANVISEAAVDGVPVIASRIAGSLGLLGEDYPGYFPVGDTRALAHLLVRAETDPEFYAGLEQTCRRLAPLFHPARERMSWMRLLEELSRKRSP